MLTELVTMRGSKWLVVVVVVVTVATVVPVVVLVLVLTIVPMFSEDGDSGLGRRFDLNSRCWLRVVLVGVDEGVCVGVVVGVGVGVGVGVVVVG